MKTQCPHCKQRYEIEDNFSGASVECSTCGKSFIVEIIPQAPMQSADMKVISWEGRPSPAAFLMTYGTGTLAFLFGIFCAFMFIFSSPDNQRRELLVGGMVITCILAIFCFLYSYITRKTTHYSIKGNKVLCRTGMLSMNENFIDIGDIRSISISQTLIERLTGCGDILISSAATSANASICFWGIKDYRHVVALLENARKK